MSGFVYAIADETGRVKIGWSADPLKRLSKISSDCSSVVQLLGIVPATIDQEAEAHHMLRPWRVNREWYRHEGPVAAFVQMLGSPGPMIICGRKIANDAHPIRKWRARLGKNSDEAAEVLGVSGVTVRRWECGLRRIDSDLVRSISNMTGINPADLRPDLAEKMRPNAPPLSPADTKADATP